MIRPPVPSPGSPRSPGGKRSPEGRRLPCSLLPDVLALLLLLFFCVSAPGSLSAQIPPDSLRRPPDSLPPDTLPAEQALPDSLQEQEAAGDSVSAQDTIPAVRLPALVRPLSPGWETGVWEWDREALLGSRALTLADLVAEVPGAVPVRGGDFGAPRTVTAFGAGGGRIRVFRDGLEILPLEGSVTDLSRVGLAGLERVRVVRSAGEIRIELESLLTADGRPYSLIEAGTGDLNTNLFRGTFSHPRAVGGAVALSMDRVDTQGLRREEPGAGTAAWVRYARPLTKRGVVAVDFARSSSDRGDLFAPETARRSDWSVRTRWDLLPGLRGDVYYASSSLSTEEPDTFDFGLETRTQVGGILSLDSRWLRGRAHLRRLSGEGLPGTSAAVEVASGLPSVGGVAGELEWDSWESRSVSRTRFRAWTVPFFGLSLFAERGGGEYGLPYLAPVPTPDDTLSGGEGGETEGADSIPSVVPGPRFSETTGTRFGFQFRWREVSLGAARLTVESDSLFPLGLPSDREGAVFPGGKREGFEVSGRFPLYPRGLFVGGSYQWWDQPDEIPGTGAGSSPDEDPLAPGGLPWRYLPRDNYKAEVSFHDTFLPTGNLEVWFDLGVRGREPMATPIPEDSEAVGLVPVVVPFYQSWFVRLQIRVVTVRAFIMWENFTVRQRNQDLPGRVLPPTRSLYGVRWTMWN